VFTGLVEETGTVLSIKAGAKSSVLAVEASKILDDLKPGDSVATNGVCLTVTGINAGVFTADVMGETLSRSSLGSLSAGSRVNLERAVPANGRLGGHIVSGHIDGTGKVVFVRKEDNAIWYTIRADASIMRYIVEKGSVAVDGISLTVAKVEENRFSVSVIPHTARETVLAQKSIGSIVNLENDIIGKYVEKLTRQQTGITKEFLLQNGF